MPVAIPPVRPIDLISIAQKYPVNENITKDILKIKLRFVSILLITNYIVIPRYNKNLLFYEL